MGMIKEFKEFAVKGNVVDMAVGVIIGGAFGKIISSLVTDVLMPPIGRLLGNHDFSSLFFNLSDGGPYASLDEAKKAGAATVNFGLFINTCIDFIIVAFVLFLAIKAINRLKREEPAAAPAAPSTKDCPSCLSAIPLKASRCAFCTGTV